ncbi:hypothetical protein GQ44DRAFT_690748 [Phaeosphaeriaceae sp. PMI808]|nr:hypothetical protein GQ44DRAFT_690748 [Phaeosphaeriaceae sp. PMI808]
MQLTTCILVVALGFTSVAATPVQARQNSLQDFKVTSVGVFTPSGRPESYPWSTITASVTDPNEINLGPAQSDGSPVIAPAGSQGLNCQAKYLSGESPLGRSWPCDPTEKGYWTMQVLNGPNGQYSSTNFNLKFKHVADVLYQGGRYTASYQAEGHFEVGDNMQGTCGGSGVCSWGLKADKKPVLITPTKL